MFCSIVLPGVPLPGLFRIRPDEIIILILLPLILYDLHGRIGMIDFAFALLGASMVMSTFWGAAVLNAQFSPRDLSEFFKVVKMWGMFRIAYFPWQEESLKRIASTLFFSLCVAALIGIAEARNYAGVQSMIKTIYATGVDREEGFYLVGTAGNPNYFGLMMSLGVVIPIHFFNPKNSRSFQILLIVTMLLSSIAMIGYSRSAILASTIAIIVSFMLNFASLRYRSTWRRIIPLSWLIALLMVLFLLGTLWVWREFQIAIALSSPADIAQYVSQSQAHRLLYRLTAIESGLTSRMELYWLPEIPVIAQSPIMGWGPGKALFGTITDNGYLLTVRRYGFIGLFVWFVLMLSTASLLIRSMNLSARGTWQRSFAVASLGVMIGLLVANVFLEVFGNLQAMSWFWLLMGVAASGIQSSRRNASTRGNHVSPTPLSSATSGKV